jgi:hypothetical protein
LEHLEGIWRRQSVMKTMGLIPDVLTSGEEFDIGLGSQRNRRTLLSWFNSGVEKMQRVATPVGIAQAYDKKVAGVVSGAGDYRPAIVLDKQRFARIAQFVLYSKPNGSILR